MRTRVALVAPFLRGGGAERVMVNLVRSIDRARFDVRLILAEKTGAYVDLVPDEVPVIDLRSSRVRYALPRLVREVNRFRPDVILSTIGYMNLALLATRPALRGSPRIIVREANVPLREVSALPPRTRQIFTLAYRVLYPRADLIIAQCDDMKADLVEFLKCPEGKIRRIYNPVDVQAVRSASTASDPFDDPTRTNIVGVGSFLDRKGFDLLIEAFAEVNSRRPDTHMTILGDGPLRRRLEEQARHLGLEDQVSFPGFADNPHPYLRCADMYVLSSRWEGLPNTMLEALACGTKVVAADCRSGPREILQGNTYGELVPVGDPRALAAGMLRYLDEPNRSGDRAEDFDVSRIVREYEEVLA